MSSKSNIRSFRYSDEVAAILEGFGSKDQSMNSKFEDLVLHCYYRLPDLEKEIALKQKQLEAMQKELAETQCKIGDNRVIWRELDTLMIHTRELQKKLGAMAEKL